MWKNTEEPDGRQMTKRYGVAKMPFACRLTNIRIQTLTKLKLNSVALVRERTIPTERPPPVGEVSANFCG